MTMLICVVCKAQNSESPTEKNTIPVEEAKEKVDSIIVFKEEIAPLDCDDQVVYCKIDNKWSYRRITVTTEVIKINKKNLFGVTSKQLKSTKIARVYFVDNDKSVLLKMFVQEAYDNFTDDVLDEARLFVINELRNLKPEDEVNAIKDEIDLVEPKTDTIVKQIKIHKKTEVELINESVEIKSYGQAISTSEKNIKYNMHNRNVITKVGLENDCNQAGRVIIEVTIDKSGKTISAVQGKGTTSDNCLIAIAKKHALQTKWHPSESAPDKQIGNITYNFSF